MRRDWWEWYTEQRLLYERLEGVMVLNQKKHEEELLQELRQAEEQQA